GGGRRGRRRLGRLILPRLIGLLAEHPAIQHSACHGDSPSLGGLRYELRGPGALGANEIGAQTVTAPVGVASDVGWRFWFVKLASISVRAVPRCGSTP